MKKRLITIFGAVMLALCAGAFSACKKDKNDEKPVISVVEFTESQINVFPDETKTLSVTGLKEGESVSYSSNDESIAMVDNSGVLRGISAGSTVVKATTSTGRSALASVTVEDPAFYPVATISVEKSNVSLFVGDEYAISPVIYYLGEQITGEMAYTSSDETLLKISGNIAEAAKSGEAFVTITATTAYGTATKKVSFTIAEKQEEIITSLSGGVAYLGKQIKLETYVNDNGTIKEIDGVNFVSADESILKIENGYAVPVIGGDTIVTATLTYNGEELTIAQNMHVYGYVSIDDLKQDASLCSAVLSATNGSYTQAEAILEYLAFNNTLSESDKASDSQIMGNIAKVNTIIELYFADGIELTFDNKATASTWCDGPHTGAGYGEAGGATTHHSGYTTEKLQSANGTAYYVVGGIWGKGATATLPAMAYSEYDEVMFGFFCYKMPGDSTFKVGDQSYTNSGDNEYNGYYKAVIKNGVLKLYDESNNAVLITLTLSSNILNGNEGLTFTMNTLCYQAEFTTVYAKSEAEQITINGKTPIDADLKEPVLYNEIVNAENGSYAQYVAIEKYRTFHEGLTTEQKAGETHTANVAKINTIIETYFANGLERAIANKPVVVNGRSDAPTVHTGAGYGEEGGATSHHSGYTTEKLKSANGTTYYVSVVESKTATFTLPAMAYSECDEAIFGFYFITGEGTTTITINGQSFTLSVSDGNWYGRVEIKNGTLTIYKDDTNATLLTVSLDADILSGNTGLVITTACGGWSQIEFTSVYAKYTVAKLS